MKRNERITSSWGFLAQGTKAALCLLVLMLSVQAVFAQKDPKQFVYNGFTYLYNGDGTVAFTGNKFKEAGKTDKDKYSKEKPYPEVIVVPDFATTNGQAILIPSQVCQMEHAKEMHKLTVIPERLLLETMSCKLVMTVLKVLARETKRQVLGKLSLVSM